LKELIEYLQKEWGTVSGAPVTFVVASIFVAGLAYAASRWRHNAIIELLRERIVAKDEQLDGYREKLHLIPAHGSEFSRLSHAELQKEALRFVSSLREWLAARRNQDSDRQHQQWLAMTNAKDEAQRKQLWDAQTTDSVRSSMTFNNEYDAKFKVKAMVLRDELLTRVPHPDPGHRAHRMYEHPTNPIGMGMVADDLERMARLLK
jgi:hypothetical protein